MSLQDYKNKINTYNKSVDYPCHECYGRGKVRNPDELDPI